MKSQQRFLTAAAVVLVLAGPAFGHAKLSSSMPAADAKLDAAPKSLSLTFNEKVQLAVLTLNADGKNVPVSVDRNAVPAAQITIALPVLMAGTYKVQWSALSVDDGHVSKGGFSFTVAGAKSSAP
jgi:methionine-rich copper-binding protein CopC